MSSYDLLASASSHVSQLKPLCKIPKLSKERFAYDVTLVALAIRSGYLVDTIFIAEHLVEQTYSTVLEELRKVSSLFNDVCLLYEPFANQSFIVKKPLLLSKLESLIGQHGTSSYPALVHLPERGDPHLLNKIPSTLLDVLQTLLDELKQRGSANLDGLVTSIQLPQELHSTACIPLAAILLDYPIAYVPSSDGQTSFLNGVPLVLYRCRIVLDRGKSEQSSREHLLLQFSCPASLAEGGVVSIERTIGHLESTFRPRIAFSLPGSTLHIGRERITLDRVAL